MTNRGREHPAIDSWPRPLAFVLSGGGSYGATQVGMLRALEQCAIQPDLIVGTSIGALNGAVVAHDPAVASQRLRDIWTRLSRRAVVGGEGSMRLAWRLVRPHPRRWRASLLSSRPLEQTIERWLPAETFEDLSVPFAVIATDVATGDAVMLRSGPLKPALVASAAIPAVFPPVRIDGRLYIDGGVAANVPVRQAITAGAKSVIVLDGNPGSLDGKPTGSILGSVLHASTVLLRSQRASEVGDDTLPILRLPQVTPASVSSFDFGQAERLIESGYRGASEYLYDAALDAIATIRDAD